jgi:hypothetical protein
MSAPHPVIVGAPPADREPLHIERGTDSTHTVVVMYCGASCVLGEEALPVPRMDWYDASAGHKATCRACRDAWLTAAGRP